MLTTDSQLCCLKVRAEKTCFMKLLQVYGVAELGLVLLCLWSFIREAEAGELLEPRNSKLAWTTQNVDLGRWRASRTL